MAFTLLITLMLVAAAPLGPRVSGVPEAVQPNPTENTAVVVRLYDAVRIPPSQRRQAQQVASRLLASVGVHVEWKICGAAPGEGRDECADPVDAGELIVRLARGSAISPAVLGFASAPGIVATALVDRIQATARRIQRPWAPLLGAVVAHELVHVLLGPESHAARGVMRAAWTDQDIQLGRIWKISLTADQRRVLATSIRGRLAAARRNGVAAEGAVAASSP